MQCFGFVRTERCLDVQPGSTLSTASLQVWCEPQLFWATDFMRGVPWTFTLSAQLKSISSIATHALEGANSVPHSLGVSKHNCAPVRLDLFVLLQPAPYFACPPLCPNNCLSHALQHHCILAGVRIICIRHNRSIIYIYIIMFFKLNYISYLTVHGLILSIIHCTFVGFDFGTPLKHPKLCSSSEKSKQTMPNILSQSWNTPKTYKSSSTSPVRPDPVSAWSTPQMAGKWALNLGIQGCPGAATNMASQSDTSWRRKVATWVLRGLMIEQSLIVLDGNGHYDGDSTDWPWFVWDHHSCMILAPHNPTQCNQPQHSSKKFLLAVKTDRKKMLRRILGPFRSCD